MSYKDSSIMRWIYEVGICSETVLMSIFYKEDKNRKKENKNEEIRTETNTKDKDKEEDKNKEGKKEKDQEGNKNRKSEENEVTDSGYKENNDTNNDTSNEDNKEYSNGDNDRNSDGSKKALINDSGKPKKKIYTKEMNNFRSKHITPLINSDMMGFFDVNDKMVTIERYYYLRRKGYVVAKSDARDGSSCYIMARDFKRLEVIKNLDTENTYRYLATSKMKPSESKHHDFLVKIKYIIMCVLGKPVIFHDLLTADNPLFVKKRTDLLIKRADNKYTSIEYERSLKNNREYIGYSVSSRGIVYNNPGFIKSRQANDFLPKGHTLDRVIIVCEDAYILNTIMKHIHSLSVPDANGKYLVADKFYLINKSEYGSVAEMILKGSCIYCKRQSKNNTLDYLQIPFRDLVLKD